MDVQENRAKTISRMLCNFQVSCIRSVREKNMCAARQTDRHTNDTTRFLLISKFENESFHTHYTTFSLHPKGSSRPKTVTFIFSNLIIYIYIYIQCTGKYLFGCFNMTSGSVVREAQSPSCSIELHDKAGSQYIDSVRQARHSRNKGTKYTLINDQV